MSIRGTHTVLRLVVEYIIVTAPILVYVVLEAIKKGEAIHILRSPEWSIATVFLTVLAIKMYIERMHQNFDPLLSILLILLLTGVTLAAAVNTYIALGSAENQSMGTLMSKWFLFLIATTIFVLIAGGAIYGTEREDG
jgi:hypothetical protein